MFEIRLGDVIDDYCVKCRRLTNHAIVSIVDGAAAKVRCKTCYHDHDYRHEQAPPTKKELKKMEMDALAAAGLAADGTALEQAEVVLGDIAIEDAADEAEESAAPASPTLALTGQEARATPAKKAARKTAKKA